MRNSGPLELVTTGLGILTPIGQGKEAFLSALLQGEQAFGWMQRPGRGQDRLYLGAELSVLSFPAEIGKRTQRAASLSGQAALLALHEAWTEARLDAAEPERIGLIVGGSNVQQREQALLHQSYAGRTAFVPPTYGLSFMDSDLCGLCTEQFGIRGMAYTVGGASASGQLAIIEAAEAVASGRVDVCIALGALMDLSHWECQALRSIGAMGSDRYAGEPLQACRPFDQQRDGFIYGEACGAVVIERADTALSRRAIPYARLSGWAVSVDGNRNPNPSQEGELRTVRAALKQAGLSPEDIDYVNPHGSGSVVGDATECSMLQEASLSGAWINTTKSLTGHGLTAAGAVEIIATLLQMKAGRLHPCANLEEPLEQSWNWVRERAFRHEIRNAISLSMGFGGLNTAICLQSLNRQTGNRQEEVNDDRCRN